MTRAEDKAAILAKILASPADDTARLVYADWLNEHDDAARAEFIRLQIELATNYGRLGDARYTAIQNRCRELLRGPQPHLYEHEVCWFHSGNGTDTWRYLFRPSWRRGFVDAVTCHAFDWLAHGDVILAAHPVERVRLTTLPEYDEFGTAAKAGGPNLYIYALGLSAPADDDPHTVWSERHTEPRVIPTTLLARRWPGVAFELPPPAL